VLTLATLSLVLPSFTSSEGGSEFSPEQLAFAAAASLALYALFVFVQIARHRDFFLPTEAGADADGEHHAQATRTEALTSLALLASTSPSDPRSRASASRSRRSPWRRSESTGRWSSAWARPRSCCW
jgi:hypothetical protein